MCVLCQCAGYKLVLVLSDSPWWPGRLFCFVFFFSFFFSSNIVSRRIWWGWALRFCGSTRRKRQRNGKKQTSAVFFVGSLSACVVSSSLSFFNKLCFDLLWWTHFVFKIYVWIWLDLLVSLLRNICYFQRTTKTCSCLENWIRWRDDGTHGCKHRDSNVMTFSIFDQVFFCLIFFFFSRFVFTASMFCCCFVDLLKMTRRALTKPIIGSACHGGCLIRLFVMVTASQLPFVNLTEWDMKTTWTACQAYHSIWIEFPAVV